jgi:hypothetical protein
MFSKVPKKNAPPENPLAVCSVVLGTFQELALRAQTA